MEALTFMMDFRSRYSSPRVTWELLEPIGDSAPFQVVRGEFHEDFVAWQNPDEVHPDLSRGMGEHLVACGQLYAKCHVRQRLGYRAFKFNCFFLRQTLFPLLPPWRLIDRFLAGQCCEDLRPRLRDRDGVLEMS